MTWGSSIGSDHPSPVRIGDRERSDAADRLSAHAAAGRLSVDELEERLERVNVAVFARDMLAVEADLPAPAQPRRGRPHPPLTVIVCLLAAVLASVLVGHPIAPLFIVAALLWRARPRDPRTRLALDRSLS